MTSLSVSRYLSFWNNGMVFKHKFYCKNFLNAEKLLGGIPAMPITIRQCSIIKCSWHLHVGTWWKNKCIKILHWHSLQLLRKLPTNLWGYFFMLHPLDTNAPMCMTETANMKTYITHQKLHHLMCSHINFRKISSNLFWVITEKKNNR